MMIYLTQVGLPLNETIYLAIQCNATQGTTTKVTINAPLPSNAVSPTLSNVATATNLLTTTTTSDTSTTTITIARCWSEHTYQ
jgi:hypothetical protein